MRRQGSIQGYIFVETVVAMGLLSISMLVIQGAVRQAILTRGQAQDYTTARFLMQQTAAEVEIQPELTESSDQGAFAAPYDRFSYAWELTKVDVPKPEIPADIPEGKRKQLEDMFKGYMGKLVVRISWSRAGFEDEAVGETLLKPEQLWQPEKQR